MQAYASHVNRQRVTDTFLSVAKLWGPSGQEKVVADAIVDQFEAMHLPGATITVDDTGPRTHSNTGNVIIDIPASADAPADAPALGLFFHMDRVPAQAPTLAPDNTIELVVEENGDIHSKDHQTNIAADDRAGYAEIKEAIHIVQEQGLTHGRIVVVGNGAVVTTSPPGALNFVASVREDRQNLSAVASLPAQKELLLFGQQGIKGLAF